MAKKKKKDIQIYGLELRVQKWIYVTIAIYFGWGSQTNQWRLVSSANDAGYPHLKNWILTLSSTT